MYLDGRIECIFVVADQSFQNSDQNVLFSPTTSRVATLTEFTVTRKNFFFCVRQLFLVGTSLLFLVVGWPTATFFLCLRPGWNFVAMKTMDDQSTTWWDTFLATDKDSAEEINGQFTLIMIHIYWSLSAYGKS